jgi:hypothetical protein
MLFKPKCDHVATPVRGRNIAYGHRTASQRAGLAAQFLLDESALTDPTVKQVATLFAVSEPYVRAAARATTTQRVSLVSGDMTVRQLKPTPCDLLVRNWHAANDVERIEFARRVGVDRLFDRAIVPVIS